MKKTSRNSSHDKSSASHARKVMAFYRDNRRMPSMTEIMRLFSFKSRNSAHYLSERLVEEGLIDKDKSGKLVPLSLSSRADLNLVDLNPDFDPHRLRLLGHIRAGFAAPAEEELADTISVGDYLIRRKEASYLLQVEGDSMRDAGILEGDMVIFERGADYKPGDIVVALTEDGYTLKYLRRNRDGAGGEQGGEYYLEAANDSYPNMHPREGEIIGVVTSTFRKYK